jgi:Macrocin-O-methyltransferase (TylF)
MMARKRSILYLTNKGLQLDLSAHALSKLLARYEIFKMVLDLPGDIVDCGVYRGASLFSWGNLIEIFAPHSQKVVIGFDTFTGFSSDLHIEEDRDHSIKLMEDPTRFRPRSMDQIMSVANTLNLSHRFRLISGDAVKTIPEFAQENRGLRFSLLNLDFDVYEPTATALKYFFPLLVPGGIIILDEYGNKGWGESDAVDAFFAGQAVRFERFGWSAGPGAYFVKQTPG